MRMNSPEGKRILALVRGGAFAHAGETEAIDLALAGISKNPNRAVLDAGCGLGGTAEYVQQHGWGQVTGFDIDATSVERAKARFPNCTFVPSDVGAVGQLWQEVFDLIYCFNTFYAFPHQTAALRELAKVARPGATLIIFEYTDPNRRYETSTFSRREDASFWQPIYAPTLETMAIEAGWKVDAFSDLTKDYLRWYNVLVHLIEERRDEVVSGYGEALFAFVHSFYSDLRDAIADGVLGGGLFTLTRENGIL
jgi:phosphoethanolamine N-methyltransferase